MAISRMTIEERAKISDYGLEIHDMLTGIASKSADKIGKSWEIAQFLQLVFLAIGALVFVGVKVDVQVAFGEQHSPAVISTPIPLTTP